MNTKSFTLYLFTLFVCLLSFSINAADIQVKVDRSQIELNETFTLIFESNEDPDDDPDFSPLEKDFQVLGKSSSSNISIINGKYTKSKRWSVSLIAQREGSITIPSIQFGNDKSPQSQITINAVRKSEGKAGEEFISELDISTETAYPQSQIIITQRLLSSRNINGYEFSALKLNGVEVAKEALGEVKQFQTKRGETPYLVLEQSYAIYPQTTGTLTIEPSVATARLSIGNRSAYDSFRSNSKTVRRASGKKTISIKPVPATFKGKHWLPAKEVQLVEEFPENTTFKAGEPVTRTISLLADGQSSSQLPEFTITEIKGLKQYPDKPILQDTPRDDGITGVQQIKVAIIPAQKGSYTLPAISVPWWNTKTNKMEIAKIPDRTFTVGATSVGISKSTTAQSKADITPTTEIEEIIENDMSATVSSNSESGDSSLWKIVALLLAMGWIITTFIYFKSRRKSVSTEKASIKKTTPLSKTYKQLKIACDKCDAIACKDALLNWAKAVYPNQAIYSLGELANHVDKSLADKINNLNSQLYKNKADKWQCENLLELCMKFEKELVNNHRNNSEDGKLEDLYH